MQASENALNQWERKDREGRKMGEEESRGWRKRRPNIQDEGDDKGGYKVAR